MRQHYLKLSLGFLLMFVFNSVIAQNTITGKVTDSENESLIGASIIVTGAPGIGTVTDVDGSYQLSVPSGYDSLTFSYIGFQPQTVAIGARSTVDMVMKDDAELLDEVVVVGYGTVNKRDLIGAIDQVNAKTIENIAVTSVDQALAGQVGGTQIRRSTGQPGGGAEILIRGVGSISSGNSPLIVIDGVPFGNYNASTDNLLSLINPNDIESISLVRDAAEKAIYGSRASSGLILITTKRGREEAPTISFNSYAGIQTVPDYERPDVLNATQLAQFLRERIEDEAAFRGTEPNIPDNLQDPSSYGEGTNWFDAITRNAAMYNADLSIRGGSEKARYAISFGYTDQEGILIESGFRRYTARANFDLDVTDWLTVGINIAPSWTETRTGDTDAGGGQFSAYNVTTVSRWADPSAPLVDENGNPTTLTQGELIPFFQANPVYKLQNQYTLRTNRSLLSSINGVARLPIKGLSFRTSLGGNLVFNNSRNYRKGSVVGGSLTPLNPDPQANTRAGSGRFENQRLVWESQFIYDKSVNKHNFNVLAGYTTEYVRSISLNQSGSRLLDENLEFFNSGNIAQNRPNDPSTTEIFFSAGTGVDENALISYLARGRYNFDEKYYVNLAVRSDGSSRFGPNNRYGVFPSSSFAWRANKESWFPQTKWLDNLKFEFGYGISGNNNIGNYRWQGGISAANYNFGGGLVRGRFLGAIPNFDLGWEESEQLDFGVTLGMLNNRLEIAADIYQNTTRDGLANQQIPRISGFSQKIDNLGIIENQGVEVQINAQPIRSQKIIWNIGANISANRNEVIQLGVDPNQIIFATNAGNSAPMSWTRVGQPVAQYYGNQITGLFTQEMLDDPNIPKYNGAQVGSPVYIDGDGDGVLEFGVIDDFVPIGDPFPTFTYGITNNVAYGDWSLQVIGIGEQGSKILDLVNEIQLNTDGVFNNSTEVLDRFRFGDDDFSVRVPNTYGGAAASQRYRASSSTAVKDGSYFSISNIKLTYGLNKLAQNSKWLNGGSVYASVQNAFLFSSFEGNPQIGRAAANNALERNVRYGAYPIARTYTVGFNFTL